MLSMRGLKPQDLQGLSQEAITALAAVMSLVHSAKLNGHHPWAYLREVLERLPSHPNSRIEELLPHRWQKPEA